MSFADFTMIPQDDLASTPDEDLAAAVASQVDAPPEVVPLAGDETIPYGRSWLFDFEARRMVRAGLSPAETTGYATLEQWCLMAIHSARYRHDAFSEEFGMENPNSLIGQFAAGEAVADWQRDITDALLVHDRVVAVEDIILDWDPTEGILTVLNIDVVTDGEETISMQGITITVEV